MWKPRLPGSQSASRTGSILIRFTDAIQKPARRCFVASGKTLKSETWCKSGAEMKTTKKLTALRGHSEFSQVCFLSWFFFFRPTPSWLPSGRYTRSITAKMNWDYRARPSIVDSHNGLYWVLVLLQDIFVSEFRQIGNALRTCQIFGCGTGARELLCLTDFSSLWLSSDMQVRICVSIFLDFFGPRKDDHLSRNKDLQGSYFIFSQSLFGGCWAGASFDVRSRCTCWNLIYNGERVERVPAFWPQDAEDDVFNLFDFVWCPFLVKVTEFRLPKTALPSTE